jgi:hypothetical protein
MHAREVSTYTWCGWRVHVTWTSVALNSCWQEAKANLIDVMSSAKTPCHDIYSAVHAAYSLHDVVCTSSEVTGNIRSAGYKLT